MSSETQLKDAILVINSGSSSLKFGLYTVKDGEEFAILSGLADAIGTSHAKITLTDDSGQTLREEPLTATSLSSAFRLAVTWLPAAPPIAIGHRVVHGGPNLTTHQRITPDLVSELQSAQHFAPLHLPASIELIQTAQRLFPQIPQFACFDTAFHRNMPEIAARLPLPVELYHQGIRRYGFHGISYESIVYQLGDKLPSRSVIAHLGSGASLCAVLNGQSMDTTMGLTPTGGIPMATRTGDLDPGVLLFLLRDKQLSINDLEQLLNRDSGLRALSNGTSDLRDLTTAAAGGDAPAQLAIDTFSLAIAKQIAAYATVLSGLDAIIFSGGIGEHSCLIRQNVCRTLNFLGIRIDDRANESHSPTISQPTSPLGIYIVPSQEDPQIARHSRLLNSV
jgi:acetate kinase